MKNKGTILLLLCIVFISCGEDRSLEYANQTAHDRWIEKTMVDNYFWYNEMSVPKTINYFIDPASFVKERLAKKDAGYSYVEDRLDTESKASYGLKIDKQVIYDDTAYAVRVLYVESDSPAQKAGLERGDWIIKRNGKYIIKNQLDSLENGKAVQFTLGEQVVKQDENGDVIYKFNDKNIVDLEAARLTTDNPIHFHQIFPLSNGKNVGYLSLNNYAAGKSENKHIYDDELRAVSNDFKGQNVTDVILDLRYNSGGHFEFMQLLATILAPQEALDKKMCDLIYNDKHPEKNETILFGSDILSGGSNLNTQRLYIITGTTTGTLSDILINSLDPYMEGRMMLIGQSTKGNHTVTHPYKDEGLPYLNNEDYILHLVDCMARNSIDKVPDGGYTPHNDFTINELENVKNTYHQIWPLGNPKEHLLYTTLYFIQNGTAPPQEEDTRSRASSIK